MSIFNDALGDELKHHENIESSRSGAIGQPVVVRVDGVGFSKFTRGFSRPFDARIAEAMDEACVAVIERVQPVLGYTQSDEITFVFWDPLNEIAYGGRLQKLASVCAAVATGAFLKAAQRLFPERVEAFTPIFDGRAHALDYELAAKNVEWRELDARRNAVSMAAHAVFGHSPLNGKSPADMKEMLAVEGIDYMSDYPERFKRGAFFRRRKVLMERTPEELARIPERFRAQAAAAKERTMTVRLEKVPPLSIVENLEGFVFLDEAPIAPERPFAFAVTP
jgi:tRNA(His) 5'-end guanylyltransferase